MLRHQPGYLEPIGGTVSTIMTNANIERYLGIGLDVLQSMPARDNNIEIDKFDRRAYDELKEASAELRGIEKKLGQDNKTWPPILRDVWATFYKMQPELTPEEQVDTPYQAMRPYIQRILEDKETEQLRIGTVMDELAAGLATIAAGEKLAQEIQQRPELKEAMQKAQEATKAHEQGNSIKAGAITEEAQSMLQQAARDIRRAIREAVEKAQDDVHEMQGVLAGWGLEQADLKRVPIGDRLKLAKRLMGHNLKRLSDLVGRLRNLARARQKERMNKIRDEIHSITVGDDLGRVLPVELAAIRHQTRRLDFYRRYTEKQLFQYDLRSKEKVGRGPMIALVDTSGSMSGSRMEWAVATAMAMADTAARQKRRTMVAFFNTGVHTIIELEPGERDVNKIIEMATVGCGGGTDYEPALKEALKKITDINYQKADIVMITDGLCRVSDQFLKAYRKTKEALNCRSWVVLLGSRPDDNMREWADEVWGVSNMTEETAGEIFERIY